MRFGKLVFLLVVTISLFGLNASAKTLPGEMTFSNQDYSSQVFAGGKVVLNGSYGESLNVFGGDVVLEGDFARNVYVYGGSVEIEGEFSGNVSAMGGRVVLGEDAEIGRDLKVRSGSFESMGRVYGDADIVSGDIFLSEESYINEDLVYFAENFVNRGFVGGSVKEKEMDGKEVAPEPKERSFKPLYMGYTFLYKFLVGAVMLLAFPVFFSESADRAWEDWFESGLSGLVSFLAVPVLVIGLMITVIGIPLALVILALYGISILIGSIIGGYKIGEKVMERTGKGNRWAYLGIGLAVFIILYNIPIIGLIFKALVVALGMGGLFLSLYNTIWG